MGRARANESSHTLSNRENPHERPLRLFIIKLHGSNFLFPSISTPPSRHTGHSMLVACHICICWVATLSFSQINPFLVTKYRADLIFLSTLNSHNHLI